MIDLQDTNYDPNGFIDWLHQVYNVRNDAQLARKMEMNPPQISKIRHRKLPVTAGMLIDVHEETGLPIMEIRKRMVRSKSWATVSRAMESLETA